MDVSIRAVIELKKITSVDIVLDELQRLNVQLHNLELGHFQLFNNAYTIVTQNMKDAIASDYFDNPDFIESFIVEFASHYFINLNYIKEKNSNIAPPWSILNDYGTIKSPPVFLSLMLGANAHINNDLPQVLLKLLGSDRKRILGDLAKMDKILMKSGREIIELFDESNRTLNFLKRHFRFMYYRPAMYTILYWRLMAWRRYRHLQNGKTTTGTVTNGSVKIARRLLTLSKMLA